jgi:hypothetical protein
MKNLVQFPINSLNLDDYESFDEQKKECKSEDDPIKNYKIKSKNVLIVSYDNDVYYYNGYDVYNHCGSTLYVVDNKNKLAKDWVEPREYTIKDYNTNKNKIYYQDIIPLIDQSIALYNPEIVILVEC